ncbi:MAG: hypothetical protein ACKVU1_01285 [bacterium]
MLKQILAFVAVMACCGTAFAQGDITRDYESEREYAALGMQNRLGLGVMAGEPTGVTAKWWMGKASAIGAGAAWSFRNDDEVVFHADYLLHRFGWSKAERDIDEGGLPFYFGLGGQLRMADDGPDAGTNGDTSFGLRMPLGLSWLNSTTQLEMFGEAVPGLELTPDTDLTVGGAIGMRYTFQ